LTAGYPGWRTSDETRCRAPTHRRRLVDALAWVGGFRIPWAVLPFLCSGHSWRASVSVWGNGAGRDPPAQRSAGKPRGPVGYGASCMRGHRRDQPASSWRQDAPVVHRTRQNGRRLRPGQRGPDRGISPAGQEPGWRAKNGEQSRAMRGGGRHGRPGGWSRRRLLATLITLILLAMIAGLAAGLAVSLTHLKTGAGSTTR
jgi:hypothetical protein